MARIWTIGYGARTLDEVLSLLTERQIRYVVDVRSTPWSRHKPEFSRDAFSAQLEKHGLRYVFMGDTLGGRPEDPSCYDADGRVDYLRCRASASFADGLARLVKASRQRDAVAIMCSEGRPEQCHRAKLVAQALVETGIEVAHIDEQGCDRGQEEVLDRIRGGQMALLGDPQSQVESLVKSRGRYGASLGA